MQVVYKKTAILNEYLALASITAGLSRVINIPTVQYRLQHECHRSRATNKCCCAVHQKILFMTQTDNVTPKTNCPKKHF